MSTDTSAETIDRAEPCRFGESGELRLYCSAHGSARLGLDEPGCRAMARTITLVEAVRRIAEVKAEHWSTDALILADVIAERLTNGLVTHVTPRLAAEGSDEEGA